MLKTPAPKPTGPCYGLNTIPTPQSLCVKGLVASYWWYGEVSGSREHWLHSRTAALMGVSEWVVRSVMGWVLEDAGC